MMKFCQNCGSQLQGGEAFCGNCGKPVEGGEVKVKSSINITKAFVDYIKCPVTTNKNLVYTLDAKLTFIIFAIIALLTAYIPFKPIKSAISMFSTNLMSLGYMGKEIKSKINSLYFTFLLFAIIFFVIGTMAVLIYSAIRGRRESFIRMLNIVVLSSIPAVFAIVLSAIILGLNSISIILITFGFALSGILLYSQFREVLTLSELDSFIALVIVNALSYSITFYIAFSTLKSKMEAFESFF